MPADYADYDEQTASATVLATTDLSNTGLAKETGGNLASASAQLVAGIAGTALAKTSDIGLISSQTGWPTSGLAKETGGNLASAAGQLVAGIAGTALAKTTDVTGISGQTGWPTSGLAKETGGNLASASANTLDASKSLKGTQASALVSAAGLTVSKDMLHANTGVTTEIAALIATGSAAGTPGGVPLLTSKANLYTITNQVVGTGGVNLASVPITQIGYDGVLTVGATTGPVYLQVVVNWLDGTTAVGTDMWIITAGLSSGTLHQIYLSGPTRADHMQIFMQTVSGTCTVNGLVNQNSRIYPDHKWLTNAFGMVGGNPCQANMPAGVLMSDALGTIAANGSATRDLPLWKGKARFSWLNRSSAAAGHIAITSPGDPSIAGTVYANDLNASADQTFEVSLPGACCRAIVSNDSGTTSMNPTLVAVIEPY